MKLGRRDTNVLIGRHRINCEGGMMKSSSRNRWRWPRSCPLAREGDDDLWRHLGADDPERESELMEHHLRWLLNGADGLV